MHGWSKIFGTNIRHSSCYVILRKKNNMPTKYHESDLCKHFVKTYFQFKI